MLLQQRVIYHSACKPLRIKSITLIKDQSYYHSDSIPSSELKSDMFSDSLRLQVPFHLRMDDAGSKSAISGLCSCIVIKSVTTVFLSLLLQSDLITFVRLNPRSQSALLAGKESSRSTSWSTFGQVSWAVLNTYTHSGFFGRTFVVSAYLDTVAMY